MAVMWRRHLSFARHIPPRQFSRRIYIRIKRRLLDKLPISPKLVIRSGLSLQTLPHLNLLSPHGSLWRSDEGWEAKFVGRHCNLGEKLDWNMRADDKNAQLWRMNLHYFEYLPSMNTKDAAVLIEDWITHCRPWNVVSSTAAWTPYAISLRISAWLQFWSTNGPFGTKKFEDKFISSLHEQTNYLCANLETDVRGNHLVKNIRALAEMGSSFDSKRAKYWRKISDKYLRQELKTQVLDDGMHFELSASYHAQVFADLLTIQAIRPHDTLSSQLDRVLKKMAMALQMITHPDGQAMQFNDAGLNMCIDAQSCLNAYKKNGPKLDPILNGNFALPNAGYYGFRSATDYLVTKFGRLGPDQLMAHAHGDWGSLEWSHKGQRVFVDQGVYEYVDGDKRRTSRSTRSHNTAIIAGCEQADFFGAFRCAERPIPESVDVLDIEDKFFISGRMQPASHKSAPYHFRSISLDEHELVILDKAEQASNMVVSSLLLHNFMSAKMSNNTVIVTGPNEFRAQIGMITAGNISLQDAVWWPDMGETQATQKIIISGKDKLEVRITF